MLHRRGRPFIRPWVTACSTGSGWVRCNAVTHAGSGSAALGLPSSFFFLLSFFLSLLFLSLFFFFFSSGGSKGMLSLCNFSVLAYVAVCDWVL
jgi:hypothetical protein